MDIVRLRNDFCRPSINVTANAQVTDGWRLGSLTLHSLPDFWEIIQNSRQASRQIVASSFRDKTFTGINLAS